MPSLLEYLSYSCNFMSILAGPTCSYNDYIAFMEGAAYQPPQPLPPQHQELANGKENGKYHLMEPSPKVRLLPPLWVYRCASPRQRWMGCSLHHFNHVCVRGHSKVKLLFLRERS